jgi:hypothetical protein
MTIRPPAPRYIGPPRNHGGSNNKPIHRVVIHSTVSPCEPGGAEQIARYFMTTDRDASAQYVTDPTTTIQAAYDSIVCYAAPPNEHSLHLEMCDIPGPVPGDKPGTARWKALRASWRWTKPNQRAMLERTARLTARLCLAYGVPIQFVGAKALRSGAHGITTHANVSAAWHESTHWDPGWWPRRRFMRLVRAHAKKLREKARA